MLQVFILITFVLLFTLSCANTQSRAVDALEDIPETIAADEAQTDDLPDAAAMLVNEFASARDPAKVDVAACLEAAVNYQDVVLAQRCYQLALPNPDVQQQLKAAKVWADVDSKNPFAWQVLAQAYINNRQYRESLDALLEAKQRGIQTDVTSVATNSIFLYGDELEKLIQHYRQARREYPQDQRLLLGEIILQTRKAEQNYYIGNYSEALTSLETLIDFDTSSNERIAGEEIFFERPYLFQSKSLRQLNRRDRAIASLERAIQRHPDYVTLYAELIELYLEKQELLKADAIADRLLDSNDSSDVFFQTGRVIAKSPLRKVQRRIKQYFIDISRNNQSTVEQRELALFRLGVLADLMDEADTKRQYLEQIQHTPQLVVAATSELAKMFASQEGVSAGEALFNKARQRWPRLAESLWQAQAQWLARDNRQKAIRLLGEIIAVSPSESLIFTRGLYYAMDGNIIAMEKDFKSILAGNPLHVDTLNAYGYTLVDLTDRIEEGSRMINQAFALDSERPAIVDSLGWSYFRQGKLQQALVLIHWAYSRMQDGEIGAHYGEILWNLGHTDEARLLLDQELKREPDNTILLDTYQRLFNTGTQ